MIGGGRIHACMEWINELPVWCDDKHARICSLTGPHFRVDAAFPFLGLGTGAGVGLELGRLSWLSWRRSFGGFLLLGSLTVLG